MILKGGEHMNTIKSTRIYFIDILKAIAIFFVIFYHCFSTSVDVRAYGHIGSYFVKSCLSVSIPLFLMVNGGLLFNKEFSLEKHVRKMVHLVFLVCFWDLLNVTLKMLAYGESLSVSEYIRKLWFFESGWSNHLWYLMALFVLYVFFPLFKCAYDCQKKSLVFFGIIALAVVFGNSFLNMLLQIGSALLHRPVPVTETNFFNQFNPLRGLYGYTFVYFLLGGFLFPMSGNLRRKIKPLYPILVFLVSIGLLTGYGLFLSVSAQEVWDTVSEGFSSVFVLAASLSVFSLSLYSADTSQSRIRRLIQQISQNSLGIYLFQSLLTDILSPYYRKLPVSGNLLGDLVFSLGILFLCSLFTTWCRKLPYVKAVCSF